MIAVFINQNALLNCPKVSNSHLLIPELVFGEHLVGIPCFWGWRRGHLLVILHMWSRVNPNTPWDLFCLENFCFHEIMLRLETFCGWEWEHMEEGAKSGTWGWGTAGPGNVGETAGIGGNGYLVLDDIVTMATLSFLLQILLKFLPLIHSKIQAAASYCHLFFICLQVRNRSTSQNL